MQPWLVWWEPEREACGDESVYTEEYRSMQVFAHFKDVMALQGMKPGMRMAVALSGGPDSTALASLVARWWSGAGYVMWGLH